MPKLQPEFPVPRHCLARGSRTIVKIRKAYRRAFPGLVMLAGIALAAIAVAQAVAQDAAQHDDQHAAPWRSKQIPNWTEQDAKDFLTNSPWVKTFAATVKQQQQPQSMGRRGMGGLGGLGLGGFGMGRRGMGYPNSGYPTDAQTSNQEPPRVTLRWESAMPVRTAELKARDNDAPTLDNEHYAIAVYGVPSRMLNGDPGRLESELKGKARLKRDGQKDIKSTAAQVLDRPGGPVIVFLFPLKAEITGNDHRVEFDAGLGRLELTQSFFTDDMVWQGKLEL